MYGDRLGDSQIDDSSKALWRREKCISNEQTILAEAHEPSVLDCGTPRICCNGGSFALRMGGEGSSPRKNKVCAKIQRAGGVGLLHRDKQSCVVEGEAEDEVETLVDLMKKGRTQTKFKFLVLLIGFVNSTKMLSFSLPQVP